jgi:hypothetical protein
MRVSKRIILKTATGLLLAVLTGCTVKPGGRTELTGVKVERGSVDITRARVYREGESLVVVGKLQRPHIVRLPGHVDIVICAPDGALLGQEAVKVPGLSSRRKGVAKLPFSARFSLIPPAGTKVVLRYHAPPFGTEEDLRCHRAQRRSLHGQLASG